ncbi:uncharacterized protein [Nyctibius grandis]|uniref:uncharacterized protein n=1 Tax=Nyctibius grandis TaxID=48427 RepID=UPI0035BC145D
MGDPKAQQTRGRPPPRGPVQPRPGRPDGPSRGGAGSRSALGGCGHCARRQLREGDLKPSGKERLRAAPPRWHERPDLWGQGGVSPLRAPCPPEEKGRGPTARRGCGTEVIAPTTAGASDALPWGRYRPLPSPLLPRPAPALTDPDLPPAQQQLRAGREEAALPVERAPGPAPPAASASRGGPRRGGKRRRIRGKAAPLRTAVSPPPQRRDCPAPSSPPLTAGRRPRSGPHSPRTRSPPVPAAQTAAAPAHIRNRSSPTASVSPAGEKPPPAPPPGQSAPRPPPRPAPAPRPRLLLSRASSAPSRRLPAPPPPSLPRPAPSLLAGAAVNRQGGCFAPPPCLGHP